MTRSLPPRPSLRYLHEEAKDLLKAHHRKDPAACQTLRLLRRFNNATDGDILAAEVGLNEAQFALAMDYGISSWEALVRNVKSSGEATVYHNDIAVGAVFHGDRLRQDTFSLAVTAALRAMGKSVGYQTVYMWSGNAFAPDIRPEEPTRSHWQLQGRDRCLDVIAAAAGIDVRPFPDCRELAEIPPMPKDEKKAAAWLKEYYAKPAASYLAHAIQIGQVVVSCGEWEFPTRGVLWCDWGLVVEARNDGTILGAAPNGRSDNVITHVRDGWILCDNGVPSSEHEISREVLRRAVHRIRGQGPVFGAGPRKVVFGLAAMDAWMTAMEQVPYDKEQWQGQDHSAGYARETAMPTLEGSKAAVAYLQELADKSSRQEAVAALDTAARQYDHIVNLLAPAMANSGDETYQAIMGDLARQKKHVQQVLRPVRERLEVAADSIEKALNVT